MPLTTLLSEIMTVKRKVKADGEEELQEVRPAFTTTGFRWALIFLVASMHPIGRSLLGQMGFVLPDQASEKRLAEEVQQIKVEVADLKKDLQNSTEKVDKLALAITGFQVDFAKYKNER